MCARARAVRVRDVSEEPIVRVFTMEREVRKRKRKKMSQSDKK